MEAGRLSTLEVLPMQRFWFSVIVTLALAAFVAAQALGQKGKGGGKGKGFAPEKPGYQPQPARFFDQPKSGNALPNDIRDRLPPGLRDMPDNHPGLADQLRKMGLLQEYPSVDPVPPEVRRQLPPGLRDKPYDHPGVANHLGKLGWSIGEDGALIPPPTLPTPTLTPPVQPLTPYESFRPFGGIFRRR
jgi:hypothetical protein